MYNKLSEIYSTFSEIDSKISEIYSSFSENFRNLSRADTPTAEGVSARGKFQK